MCTNLAKRGATYYFRRVIPAELRPAFRGKAEFMVSLRTKDRETAKRLIPERRIETDRALDAARRLYPENGPERAPSAQSERAGYVEAERLQASLEAAEAAEMEQAGRDARREDVAELVEFLKQALKGSTREMPRHLRAVAYLTEGLELDRTRLREHLGIARSELRRRSGLTDGPAQPSPAPGEAARTAPAGPQPLPLLELFDAYARESEMRATTAAEWRGNLRALIAFVGHDDASRLTVEDVDSWRDHLLSGTTNRGRPRAARTVKDKYVSALRSTLNYAISKRKLPENVAAQVDVRVPRRVKLRERDFTGDEARAILAATVQPAEEEVSEYTARARRWIPWLCAYTGGRVNEFSQLRGSDVAKVDGVWTVLITPEAGTVKSGEARLVPLHPHLVEQGFPAVAKAAGDAPLFYDPRRVRRPGPGNRHVKKVGENLAAWVRSAVGITDPNVQPNHGWRHLFKTRAGEAGIPERVADAIQGHAPRSVGQTYGTVSLAAKAEAIGKLPRFLGP